MYLKILKNKFTLLQSQLQSLLNILNSNLNTCLKNKLCMLIIIGG